MARCVLMKISKSDNINEAFGKALKLIRDYKEFTQEDFSDVSSRTYISTLERGLKSPTIEKIEAISELLDIHPLSLLTLAYSSKSDTKSINNLINKIKLELDEFLT